MAQPDDVELSVYNVRGQRVRTLLHQPMPQGRHEVVWHGETDTGAPCASGVYFCRLQAGQRQEVRKLLLLK